MSDDKEIEVVTGDGSNLNLSPVSEHITSLKPKAKNLFMAMGKL